MIVIVMMIVMMIVIVIVIQCDLLLQYILINTRKTNFPFMTTKKTILLAVAAITVLVPFMFAYGNTSSAVSEDLESSCYSLLLEKANVLQIVEKNDFLSSLPNDYQGLDQSLFSAKEYASGPPIVKTNFKDPLFRKNRYRFGDSLGTGANLQGVLLDLGNSSTSTSVTASLFDIEFAYDLDDDELLWCKAALREIKKGGVTPADLNSDLIAQHAYPQRVNGNVENISEGGSNFKRIVVEKDKMDKSYAEPIYTIHMIMAIPETMRTDFNPYTIVDSFADITNRYYTEFIPTVRSDIEKDQSLLVKEIISDGEIKIEGYRFASNEYRKKVYGIRTVVFNDQIINEYSYIPWLRYNLVKEMVRLGQSDVANLWLSHMSSEDLYSIVNFYNSSISLEESGLDASIRDNSLDNQIDRFVDMAADVAERTGDENPEKSDDVKLFWRIKSQVESGVSAAELEQFIIDYPEYLAAIESMAAGGLLDLDASAWYAPFVKDLLERKVVAGYPDRTYRPGNSLNRAEIAKIVVELFELSMPTSVTANPFPDVDKAAWFAPYVAAAKSAGAVGGYPDGSFRPSGVVNRAEAMKMILTASGADIPTSTDSSFGDVSADDWFAKFVNFANSQNIVAGYGDGSFRPGNQINRAEIAKIASLAKQILKKQEKKVRRAQ